MKSLTRWKKSEIEDRQKNTLWPDTLRNSALVDAFLWRGSRNATPIQRIGIFLSGLLFVSPAVLLLRYGVFEPGPTVLKYLHLS